MAEVTRRGGTVRRGLTRHTALFVVGRSSYTQLQAGRLQAKLARADDIGAACLSERTFLRALGLLPAAAPTTAALRLNDLPGKTGLRPETIRLLVLFDLVQPAGDQCSFRDLVVAREVGRLLREGLELAAIVAAAERAGGQAGSGDDQPLARLKLASDEDGRLALRFGDGLAELDGQMRLPLADAGNPSIDDLFDSAEDAEQDGDLDAAEDFYRRCMALDRSDPIAPFNLANVLRDQGQESAAIWQLRVALGVDPSFAEAWYNLALLLDARADKAAAQNAFERAIAADPGYADPVFNLAQLQFEAGAYAAAQDLWQRYLALDPDSDWSRKARQGVAVCRQQAGSS